MNSPDALLNVICGDGVRHGFDEIVVTSIKYIIYILYLSQLYQRPKAKPSSLKADEDDGYETKTMRIPLPWLKEVETLLKRFHQENAEYEKLPTLCSWWQVLGVSRDAKLTEVILTLKCCS